MKLYDRLRREKEKERERERESKNAINFFTIGLIRPIIDGVKLEVVKNVTK
jgi:hypothetical protein